MTDGAPKQDKGIDVTSAKQSFSRLKEETVNEYNKFLPHFKKYGFLLLLLIPLLLNFYLRMQGAILPVTDVWARDTVINNLVNNVRSNVDQQYPNLPQGNKERIVQEQVNKMINDNRASFDQNIKQLSTQFKSYMQDDNGAAYLIGIDPYYWTRHARNILKNGHPGDVLDANGVPYDNHMLAPIGREAPKDMFHAYFLAWSYKTAHLLNSKATLESVTLYNPAILMALATLFAFLMGRRVAGNLGGFFSALIVSIHSSILVRTTGGFSDTDPYQVIFPLLVGWLFLECFNAQSKFMKYFLPILTGATIGFYSFVWGGWWYLLLYVMAAGGIYLTYYFITAYKTVGFKAIFKGTKFSRTLLILSLVVVSAIPSIIYFSGSEFLLQMPQRIIGFVQIHEVGATYIWPNVYITVAEQNEGTIGSAVDSMGGKTIFYLSLLGILLPLIFKKLRDEANMDVRYSVYLLIWLATTLWAVTRGVRFNLMVVAPFAIGIGMMIQILPLLIRKLTKFLRVENRYYILGSIGASFIFGLVLVGMFPFQDSGLWHQSKNIAFLSGGDMNDAWWSGLSYIRVNSSSDAIVTSWWDFGHWFKYIADRPVTFDGTSQNNPQAHWVGRILATEDERYAAGILRMLDCGGNTGFERLDNHINDIARTRDVIDPMLKMSRQESFDYLQELSDSGKYPSIHVEDASEILNLTHCDPPEAFFIASNDMVGKAGVWGHFGLWDFNKSLMYNELIKEEYGENPDKAIQFLKERFNLSDMDASQIYYEVITFDSKTANNWISPWPGYQNVNSGCSKSENDTIFSCAGGININTTEFPYQVIISNNLNLQPYSLVYPTATGAGEVVYNPKADFSVVLYQRPDNSTNYLITHKDIADSMFTKMYFMGNPNLRYFKLFDYRRAFNGGDLYIYKLDWEQLKRDDLQKDEEVKNG